MSTPFKACPKCQAPAPLDARTCAKCGHQYRTQFTPADQTQAFGALSHNPPPATVPAPAAPAAPSAARDNVEWSTLATLCWVGMFFFLAAAIYAGRALNYLAPSSIKSVMLAATGCLALFLALAALCALRLRRLYVYETDRDRPWWASAIVLAMLLGLVFYLPEFPMDWMRPQQSPEPAFHTQNAPPSYFPPSSPEPAAPPAYVPTAPLPPTPAPSPPGMNYAPGFRTTNPPHAPQQPMVFPTIPTPPAQQNQGHGFGGGMGGPSGDAGRVNRGAMDL